MKKLYSLLFTFTFTQLLMAQNPCGWFKTINPDQETIDAERIDVTVKKLSGTAPIIDGKIDDIWKGVEIIEIAKHKTGSSQDPNIKGTAQFLYDDNWFYINVIVSGDLYLDDGGSSNVQDHIEFMFQNTWGGKGSTSDHCEDAAWANWYWEKDGDRKWIYPVNRATSRLVWLDQDARDDCFSPLCEEIEEADWITLDATQTIKYGVYTSETPDTIIYETALHLVNWMKYDADSITTGLEGHDFGFDISIRDFDGSDNTDDIKDQFNISDPENNAWAWAKAIGKFTFGLPTLINNHEINMSISPNPATTSFSINSDLLISKVEIFNILGQIVLTDNNISNKTINVSDLNSGIHIINLYSDETIVATQKLIIR